MELFEYATKDKPWDFLYIEAAVQKGCQKNFNKRIDVHRVDVVCMEETYYEEMDAAVPPLKTKS